MFGVHDALAQRCRSERVYRGLGSENKTLEMDRTADQHDVMSFDLTAKTFDVYSYERLTTRTRMENCGSGRRPGDPPRQCPVSESYCQTFYDKIPHGSITQTLSIHFPKHLGLKKGQKERFWIHYNPLSEVQGQAVKIDVFSWHHWYRAVRVDRNEIAGKNSFDVTMSSIWDKN